MSRDIDVLFLGAEDVPRRNRLLKRLRKNGVRIHAVGSYGNQGCWGKDRTELLNRTKILLNLARTPGEFPDLRLILGMAIKALGISEPIYRPNPFVPGEHFFSASREEMPEKIWYYLTHEEVCASISDRAHRLITQDVTMERSVSQIVDLTSDATASPRTESIGRII